MDAAGVGALVATGAVVGWALVAAGADVAFATGDCVAGAWAGTSLPPHATDNV